MRAFLIGSPYRPIQYSRVHGTWHKKDEGRTIFHYVRNLKMERTHTLTHSHRGRFAAYNGGGGGGGLWLLSDAHENQQIFFFLLCFAATLSKQQLHESSSSVAAANNRATTTATTITKDENNSNTATAASVAAGVIASVAQLAFFLASKRTVELIQIYKIEIEKTWNDEELTLVYQ